MKKIVTITAFIVLLSYGCTAPEANSDLGEFDLEQSQGIISPIASLLQKKGFKQSLLQRISSSGKNNGIGNGVFVIQNHELYVPCGSDDNYFVCAYAIEDGFYASTMNVKFMPDGTAQFFSNKKNVAVEIYTLPDFELIYSNLCMEDKKKSSLHVNLKGNYELIYDPDYDIEYYDFIFEEVVSANNMQITATVNDATTNLDIDLLTFDCIEPTTEKKVKVTSLFKQNGGQNFKIRGL